jgi:magnesium chelatase family protein
LGDAILYWHGRHARAGVKCVCTQSHTFIFGRGGHRPIEKKGENSSVIRERVIAARALQTARYEKTPGIYANTQMSSKQLREICIINSVGEALLKKSMERLKLSARAYDRILKVSRTITDLAGSELKMHHL